MAKLGEQLLQPEQGWSRYKACQISNFKYSGSWSQLTGSNGINWNDTSNRMASTDGNAIARVKFYSSKIRVMSTVSSGHSAIVEVDIDGIKENISLKGSTLGGVLVFEKELELCEHTITFTNKSSGYIIIDCIDLEGDGNYFADTVASTGFQLLQPEKGWKRYNDNYSKIKCINRSYGDKSSCYEGQYSLLKADSDNGVKFTFKGTKFRFIGSINLDVNRCDFIDVYIDGVLDSTFTQISIATVDQIICYEKLNLQDTEHDIFITGRIGTTGANKMNYIFDAIDINEEGYFITKVDQFYPESDLGWNRFDNIDNIILFNGTGWRSESDNNSYDKTIHYTNKQDDYYQFDCIGKGFRLIVKLDPKYTNNSSINVLVDDIIVGNFDHYSKTSELQMLKFEHMFNDDIKHTVKVINTADGMNIDAIEIKDGTLLPTLSRDYEFPVAIIEKEELEPYCKSLINKEEQLLITPKGEIYLTNGEGGYINCNLDMIIEYTKNTQHVELSTFDKSIIGSINEVNEKIENIQAPKLFMYEKGEEFNDNTGGWSSCPNADIPVVGFTKTDSYMEVRSSLSSNYSSGATNLPIDMTGISSIIIQGEKIQGTGKIVVAVLNKKDITVSNRVVSKLTSDANEPFTIKLDVSSISGPHWIAFGTGINSNSPVVQGRIYRIYAIDKKGNVVNNCFAQGNRETITPVENEISTSSVLFETPFDKIPIVTATPEVTDKGVSIKSFNISDVSKTGFNVHILSTDNNIKSFNWMAIQL